jgi:hypothetical protein
MENEVSEWLRMIFGGPVHEPPRSERDIRPAMDTPGGRDRYIRDQDEQTSRLNHGHAAMRFAELARSDIAALARRRAVVESELTYTPLTILKAPPNTRIGVVELLLVLLLIIIFVACGMVSVTTLSGYALRSASPLFAESNVATAILFSTLPTFLSIALKLYKDEIASLRARRLYGLVWFILGISAFAVWLVSSAVALTPDVSLSAALLADGQKYAPAIMLGSTVLAELGIGYTVLAGLGSFLTPKRQCEECANPAYAILEKERDQLAAAIEERQDQLVLVEDYLDRLAAARVVVRGQAENDLARVEELFKQAQLTGLALGITSFFKIPENES